MPQDPTASTDAADEVERLRALLCDPPALKERLRELVREAKTDETRRFWQAFARFAGLDLNSEP